MYEILANTTLVVHTALIVAVFVGIGMSIRVKWFRPIESAFLLMAIVIWSLYGACPLTTLESYFRTGSFGVSYFGQGGFIPFYFNQWFNVHLSATVVTAGTYLIAIFFFILTIEWLVPFIKKVPILKLIHK